MEKKVLKYSLVIGLVVANIVQLLFTFLPINPPFVIVPNEETAIAMAEAVFVVAFGNEVLSKKPFVAKLDATKRYWLVCGTLPAGYVGGVPEMKIRKSDGRIMKVKHSM